MNFQSWICYRSNPIYEQNSSVSISVEKATFRVRFVLYKQFAYPIEWYNFKPNKVTRTLLEIQQKVSIQDHLLENLPLILKSKRNSFIWRSDLFSVESKSEMIRASFKIKFQREWLEYVYIFSI